MRKLIDAAERKYKKKRTFPGSTNTKIIVKIEKHEAVNNFDAILSETDAVMVARGDLGVETPIETVPVAQKMIIAKCLEAAKPVITATQMLNSMVENPRPTRAEVSDIANAVIDHTDCVMLSDETAIGKYPVKAVDMMRRVVEKTEHSPYDDIQHAGVRLQMLTDTAIPTTASSLASITDADALVVATISGHTARVVSQHRPELPILASAVTGMLARQMNLSWGVTPFVMKKYIRLAPILRHAMIEIKKNKLVKKGDDIVIIAGDPPGVGRVNYVKVERIT